MRGTPLNLFFFACLNPPEFSDVEEEILSLEIIMQMMPVFISSALVIQVISSFWAGFCGTDSGDCEAREWEGAFSSPIHEGQPLAGFIPTNTCTSFAI